MFVMSGKAKYDIENVVLTENDQKHGASRNRLQSNREAERSSIRKKGRSISRPTAQSKREKNIDCVMQVNEACLRYGICAEKKSNNLTLFCELRANEAVQADAAIMRRLVMLVIKT